jgi:hypothetical protein
MTEALGRIRGPKTGHEQRSWGRSSSGTRSGRQRAGGCSRSILTSPPCWTGRPPEDRVCPAKNN